MISFDRRLARRLLVVFLISATAASVLGGVAGGAAYAVTMAQSSPDDVWAELGAFIFGALAGMAVGGVAYVAVGLAGIARVCPAGQRLRPGLALIGFPLSLVVILGAISGVSGAGAEGIISAVVALAALGASVAGTAWVSGVWSPSAGETRVDVQPYVVDGDR